MAISVCVHKLTNVDLPTPVRPMTAMKTSSGLVELVSGWDVSHLVPYLLENLL